MKNEKKMSAEEKVVVLRMLIIQSFISLYSLFYCA